MGDGPYCKCQDGFIGMHCDAYKAGKETTEFVFHECVQSVSILRVGSVLRVIS